MLSFKYFMKQSWLLIICSFCFGLLIAVTNAGLAPRIERNRIEKLNHLAGALLPEADSFIEIKEPIEIQLKGKKKDVTIYQAKTGDNVIGWYFTASGSGFVDKIELVIAVDKDFTKLAGFDVLACNETPRVGDRIKNDWFKGQFNNAPVGNFVLKNFGKPKVIDSEIISISGATYSSGYVVEIINNFLEPIKNKMLEKGLIINGN